MAIDNNSFLNPVLEEVGDLDNDIEALILAQY